MTRSPKLLVSLLGLLLCLSACGRSASSWTERGDRLLRSNDLESAERAYNRALEADPHYAPAVYGKGWALYSSGFEELQESSRQLFSRAIDYDPKFYGGYRGKGVLLLEEGNLPAAERFLRQAWELAPNEPTVVESMGQLYLRAGHIDPAEQVFREAIRLAPERGELYRFLADVELARGDFDGALQELERGRAAPVSGQRGLLLLEEGEVFVHLSAARALFLGQGVGSTPDPEAALRALEQAEVILSRMREAGLASEADQIRQERLNPLREQLEPSLKRGSARSADSENSTPSGP